METISARPIPVSIPGFTYRGIEVQPMTLSGDMIADLGTGTPAYKLAPDSTPLAYRVALYSVGRDLAWGEPDAEKLPGEVKEAGKMVYEHNQKRPGKGGWHKDGVLFLRRNEAPKGMAKPSDEYALARYFRDIKGFDEKSYKIKSSPETTETLLWLPFGGGRYYVPTANGIFHPVTGTPFETIENEQKAIKRWMETGLTEEQARKELSRFYRGSEGTRAVVSWSNDDGGSLCVDLNLVPGNGYGSIGSFPASRSPSGARQPANSGYMLITDEEARRNEKTAKRLAKIESGMKNLLDQKE